MRAASLRSLEDTILAFCGYGLRSHLTVLVTITSRSPYLHLARPGPRYSYFVRRSTEQAQSV